MSELHLAMTKKCNCNHTLTR